MSYVYLLHFDRPIAPGRHTTQHYIGHADDLARRIQTHARGRYSNGNGCAKLCAVAKERGIGFTVARLWRGGYELERRLKAAKAGRRLCPVCGKPLPLRYAEEVSAEEIAELLLAKEQIVDLSRVAAELELDMGAMGDAINTGSSRALKEFGFNVQEVKARVAELRAEGNSLNEAMAMAMIEAGEEKIGRVGARSEEAAGQIEILENVVEEVQDEFARGAAEGFAATLAGIGGSAPAAAEAMGALAYGSSKVATESIPQLLQWVPRVYDAMGMGWLPVLGDVAMALGVVRGQVEALREAWGVESGQVWMLPGREEGRGHRLVVGDCTDPAVMRLLMQGERAVMAVTSPPYGVGKEYETKGVGAWFETIRPAIGQICRWARLVVWQIGDLYATGTQFIEPTFAYSINMFRENNFRPIWIRIWEKQGANFGVGPYHLVSNKPVQEYELIAALGEEEQGGGGVGESGSGEGEYEWVVGFAGRGHRFVKRLRPEERREWGYSGVWRINTVRANDQHPAMFPVELPERCVKMHSDVGDLVLEPFCGSGTTIVACENLGRRCAAVEREGRYVAVCLQRYLDAFGIRGELREA